MPAFTEVAGLGAQVDFTTPAMTVQPVAGGASWLFAEVLKVDKSFGAMPGKAHISFRNIAAADEIGPITMGKNALAENVVKYWSRVNITSNNQTVFTGALTKRRDQIGGNSIGFEYWDDRWLLSKIRLRGCVCYDPYDGTIKLIPRLDPHVSPNGYRNCTRVPGTNGTNGEAYVFLAPAEWGTNALEYDPNTGGDDGKAGTAIDWTPERWIKYLQYITTLFDASAGYAGFKHTWPMLDTTKLGWPAPSFQDGTMRGKMPDINFKGQTVLQALGKACEISGEYDIGVDYEGNYLKFNITTLGQQNANTTGATQGKTIYIQRSGQVLDMKSVFDGVAETDASEFVSGVLYDAAPYRIESQFWFSKANRADPDTGYQDAMTLPWSDAEQAAFLKIISTGKGPDGNDIPGGSGGSLKNTTQALQVARTSYPKVFRALQLDGSPGSGLVTIMNGFNAVLAAYPWLTNLRPAMPEQLQPYFDDPTQPNRRGRLRVPIRIQVSDVDTTTGGAKFHDVAFNNGLRITNDGLIWLDGLTDDTGNSLDWIYTNTLIGYDGTAATLPKMRCLKINMAVEHDARMSAAFDLFFDGIDYNNIGDMIDQSLKGTTGPRLQHYVLNPEGFIHEDQLKSYPALPGAFQTTDGGSPPQLKTLTTPCDKTIYNNQANLTEAAGRVFQRMCALKKTSTFRLPGIRLDLDAGDYIEKLVFVGGLAGEEYKIGKPVKAMSYEPKDRPETVINCQ